MPLKVKKKEERRREKREGKRKKEGRRKERRGRRGRRGREGSFRTRLYSASFSRFRVAAVSLPADDRTADEHFVPCNS